jgi:hypothetical protein
MRGLRPVVRARPAERRPTARPRAALPGTRRANQVTGDVPQRATAAAAAARRYGRYSATRLQLSVVDGHAPGPSTAVAGVSRMRPGAAQRQQPAHRHRCVAIHSQSETTRVRLASRQRVTEVLSQGG